MTAAEHDDTEKPLDPEVEAVRRRLARLMAVSIGIMMIGLLAVLGAIVYKMSGPSRPAATDVTRIALPAGYHIVDQSMADGRILLRLRSTSGEEMLSIYSVDDFSLLGRVEIGQLPQ